MVVLPKYPVYVPSKGRYESGLTVKFLLKDKCPFYLVVEEQEYNDYASRYGSEHILVLPFQNQGLIAARNWIKQHSIDAGYARHWQLDDNMQCIKRRYKGKRIPCDAGIALAAVEDFVDRYENIAVAGLNYEMFLPNGQQIPPFHLNVHVYSCSLILNSIPHTWRLRYNDDTDLCLQVLADGWCTVLVNAFLVFKTRTMKVKGGNTTDLYQGDGRLKMAKALERVWPGVVETNRRFQRPQHVVADAWRKFDTPLKLKEGVSLSDFEKVNEYGMQLVQKSEIKSPELQAFYEGEIKKHGSE